MTSISACCNLVVGWAVVCGLCRSVSPGAWASESAPLVLELSAGPYDREKTPIVFTLPEPLAQRGTVRLILLDDGREVSSQRIPGEKPAVTWVLAGRLAAGGTQRYQLIAGDVPSNIPPGVSCRDEGTRLVIQAGSHPVLAYNHTELPSPAGLDPVFAKSGHIHPVYTPSGRLVTDDFPPDHAHQHGLFWAWVNTTFQGRKIDFWNQAGRTGRVRHERVEEVASGPVFAQFTAVLRHECLTANGAVPVIEEKWTVRVYASGDQPLIDLESVQTCATDAPLVVNEYHYGGLALRGARDWFRQPQSDFLTSEGKTRSDGNHTRARWVIAHGLSGGQPAGICILGHPQNFRTPQPVRLHPEKPYFCFSPMILGTFTIDPGRPYVSRYRLAAFDGPVQAERAERLWHDFAEPPTVRVVNTETSENGD